MALTLTLKKAATADKDLTALAVDGDVELGQEVENEPCRFSSPDVGLTLLDEDGFFTTAFAALDQEVVYPNCYYLQISKGGSVVWEGDLDPTTVSFDDKLKRVSCSFLHKLKRLDHYRTDDLIRTGMTYKHRRLVAQATSASQDLSRTGTIASGVLTDAGSPGWTVDGWKGGYIRNNSVTPVTYYEVTANAAGTLNVPDCPDGGPYTYDLLLASVTDADAGVTANELQYHGAYIECTYQKAAGGTETGYILCQVVRNTSGGVFYLFPGVPKSTAIKAVDYITVVAPTNLEFSVMPLALRITATGVSGLVASMRTKAQMGLIDDDLFTSVVDTTGTVQQERAGAISDRPFVKAFLLDETAGETGYMASTILAEPYNKHQSIGDLVAALFTTAGIGAGDREITVTEYSRTLDYVDLTDKTVAEALTEIAAVANAVYFCTPAKYYFVDRDQYKSTGSTKAIDSLVMEVQRAPNWSNYRPQVRVGGRDGKFYRLGIAPRMAQPFDLSTDFIDRMETLKAICARLYTYFGARRRAISCTVSDDGTAYALWDKVQYNSVDYVVTKVSEPLRSVETAYRSSIKLELVEKGGTAPTAGSGAGIHPVIDYDEPIPPMGTRIAVEGAGPYDYAVYSYFDPQGDLWKLCKAELRAVNNLGNSDVSVVQSPFTRLKPAAPTTGTTATGTPMGARTYYVAITYYNAYGESVGSLETTQVLTNLQLCTVTAPAFPSTITKCRVYIGTVSGTLYYQGEIASTGGTWTEPATPLITTGVAVPTFTLQRIVIESSAANTRPWAASVRWITYTGAVSPYGDSVNINF